MDTRRLVVGISGSYGGMNLGDEAILEGIVRELRSSSPVAITVFTHDREDTLKRHNVEHAVEIHAMTREEARAEVARLDLLILGGGGILYDRDVELYLREVALAHETETPVVVYAISAGPLDDSNHRTLIAKQLNQAVAVTVRDRQAMKLLEEAGVEQEIVLTADPALLLEPAPIADDALQREDLDGKHPLVGFSIREPGPAAPDIDIEHYHTLLANTADFMVARFDAHIIFVPMERKNHDMQQSHAVVGAMQHASQASVLKGEYTAPQLLTIMGHFQFCVGMRLHFLIFAALHGIPLVALPYASKVRGFLDEMDLPMPPLEEVTTGGLIAHVDRAWDKQGEIRRHIEEHLPALQERARETNRIVTGILSNLRRPTGSRQGV